MIMFIIVWLWLFTLISEVLKVKNWCRTVQDLMTAGQRRAAVAERHADALVDLSSRHISENGKHVDG